MFSEIKVFESKEFGSVRVVEQDGEPWFVASDIAKALGYANPQEATREHCKKVNKIAQPSETLPTANRPPVFFNIIPESDVYRLIMRSNLSSAERFQDWVVEEVLPSIRKYGAYVVEDVLNDPDMLINALQALKAERAARLEAERTKALIGSRREATAMATASAAVRKVSTLEVEAKELKTQLGIAGEYRTAKSLKWLSEIFDVALPATYSLIGKALNKISKAMNIEAVKIDDPKFGTVNAYHISVIDQFHANVLKDDSILEKYRR